MSTSLNPPSSKKLTELGHFINGTCSSSIMIACVHPLRSIQTNIMSGKKIPQVSTLYRGIAPSMWSVVPIQSISFLTHGFLINYFFNSNKDTMTYQQKIATGSSAGISSSFLATFFDRLMILQQLNGGGVNKTVQKIYKLQGIAGFMKGYYPSLMREMSFSVTLFGTGEILAKTIENKFPKNLDNKHFLSLICGGALAGALGGALTTPIDVIKTRMQGDLNNRYSTMFKTIAYLIKNEGYKSFFKGILIRSGFVGLAISVLGVSKEKLPRYYPNCLFQNNNKI